MGIYSYAEQKAYEWSPSPRPDPAGPSAACSPASRRAAAGGAAAGDRLPGPVPAEPVEIVDGDTVRVIARIWLDQSIEVLVRIRGIDAAELRADCAEERDLAEAAAALLDDAVDGAPLTLTDIESDKYFGRVVADVALPDGRSLGPWLLESGLVRPYDGGTREDWCPEIASAGG